MNRLPIRNLARTTAAGAAEISGMDAYRPLVSAWVLKLCLACGWFNETLGTRRRRRPARPFSVSSSHVFAASEFPGLTGIPPEDVEALERDDRRVTALELKGMLEARLRQVAAEPVDPDAPLFRNLRLLADRVGLGEPGQALLAFAVLLEYFPGFYAFLCERTLRVDRMRVATLMEVLCGHPRAAVHAALGREATLAATGLLTLDEESRDLDSILKVPPGLSGILLEDHPDADAVVAHFVQRSPAPQLSLEDFPHLKKETELLRAYLVEALARREAGCNLLVYGRPGTGKTEYARALAVAVEGLAYEVRFAGRDGDPIPGASRFNAFQLSQRLLAGGANAVIVFDEIEDVFPQPDLLSLLLGEGTDPKARAGKAWINRTLEQNPVPAIWIANVVQQIDPAYLRRFDYSVEFPEPPRSVRQRIAERHLHGTGVGGDWLSRLAARWSLNPAQLEKAAKVARLAGRSEAARAEDAAEAAIRKSGKLLGVNPRAGTVESPTGYDLVYINASLRAAKIVAGLKRRPRGTFCFYGPSGTGKSAFARHIADALDRELVVRRASDLLSKWLGETEQQIARMFDEAREKDAVLLLDEADSFLGDRRDARARWEVTQANEMLTQMEGFDGIFICTTNLVDRLDQASLRRFASKVKFEPLALDQRRAMFMESLVHLKAVPTENEVDLLDHPALARMDTLTPGDFAAVIRQFEIIGEAVTAAELLAALQAECVLKGVKARRLGFV